MYVISFEFMNGSAVTIKIWDIESATSKKEINLYSEINYFDTLENGNLISASDESVIIWEKKLTFF